MTPAELRRAARDAESRGDHGTAAVFSREADRVEAQAGADDELVSLTLGELVTYIDHAAARVMAASAELFRREGDDDNEKEVTR